jgi:methylglutaconyl-CoA hydratase
MSPAPWQTLSLDRQGTVATLVMRRPEVHNAFDATLIAEMTAALQEVDADPSVRALVLTGAGSTFSAGADLNWMRGMAAASEQDNREDSLRLATLMRTLNFLSKPTIARVNGSAYGGGVGLVACCDIAIGVDGAKFSLSEVKLGLVPAVISPLRHRGHRRSPCPAPVPGRRGIRCPRGLPDRPAASLRAGR